ncbi:hypothetical protein MGA5115_01522 [Marinomonas gallaica]|uniref:DUF5610 domain-containing protein n=1 Tax=Marinomonas gallaica TaxID=1806667 RepID=A0A1C3JQ60_9GAMM|nr:DUF5610 domain-containing protein [Marinomonas gallaica]SBT17411.1 hypothetical protein MGA5115_01522 [Marinomonas gallaica]SBT19603.1 hypothetical protein MGA5116_00176 [Marinomonas gallaica]
MSDPLKGLGSSVPTYTPNHRSQETQSGGATALKQWGSDGYSPSSASFRSMGIVQQSLSARFTASFGSPNANAAEQATNAKERSENDFSPEKVAQRILSHVGNYMENLQSKGADDERLASVLETAKEAVQKGMEDAKEKLDALGWLMNSGVEQGITETEDLLSEGFDALDKAFFADTEAVSQVAAMTTSSSYRREDYSQIQMTTQEGDVVSLNLYSLSASEQGEAASISDNGMSYARYESANQAFAFDFSVEGDLNEDELAAIKDMMNSAGEVSDLFFEGDVAGALQRGFEMGFDSTQLANFSMTLQTSQTMKSSQAVSAYGQNPGMRSIQEPLSDYRQALEETVKKASDLFDDFRNVVESTMTDIMSMREEQSQKMDDMRQVFEYQKEMIERISQWLMPEETTAPDSTETAEPEGVEGTNEEPSSNA